MYVIWECTYVILKSIRISVVMKSTQVCHLQYDIHMYVIWECTYVILKSIRMSVIMKSIQVCHRQYNIHMYVIWECSMSYWRVYVFHIEEYTYTYFILKSVYVFHIQEYTYTYFILKSVDVFHIDEFACTYFISKSLYVFHVEEYTFAIHVSYESLRISYWRVYVLRLQFDIRMESICIRIASPIWIRILFNMKYVDSEYVYSSIWNT